MGIHDFWLFALASLLLNITPGNDMLYVISRSTGLGTRAGILSALGIMGGCFVHTLAAFAGLSAIIARSALVFDMIRYAGAVYLVYLGLTSFLKGKNLQKISQGHPERIPGSRIFLQGMLTNILNPKVALFFLAFLPQFVDRGHGQVPAQLLLLGIWFNISGTLVNLLVAVFFWRVGQWMGSRPGIARVLDKLTGLVLVGIGIKLAFTHKK
jgi:threonine/homoserine/homoserine lactone efflux protein